MLQIAGRTDDAKGCKADGKSERVEAILSSRLFGRAMAPSSGGSRHEGAPNVTSDGLLVQFAGKRQSMANEYGALDHYSGMYGDCWWLKPL